MSIHSVKKVFLTLILVSCMINLSYSQFAKVVAQDGSGTSKKIATALSKIPTNSDTTILIFIKNGTYNEKLLVGSSMTNVHLIGESADSVIITYDDYNGDGTSSTASSYTLWVAGDNFYAENLTIKNSAGSVGQAVALRTTGDYGVFKNCKVYGFQDTYYAHSGIQYLNNCYFEGATDFIFGDATAIFDSCTINCVSGGQYITAPADSKLTSTIDTDSTFIHGLLFKECDITASSGVSDNSYYLGRPWQDASSSVYYKCTLGSHIKDAGWATNSDIVLGTTFFAEYKSLETDGSLVDVSGRATWTYQLTDDDTVYYQNDYFLKKDDVEWDPIPMTVALDAPTNLTGDDYVLSWDTVKNAIGYTIIRNDSTVGFSETATYTDESAYKSIDNTYKVKSISANGNLSEESSNEVSFNASSVFTTNATTDAFELTIVNNTISSSVNVNMSIYNLSGKLMLTKDNINELELNSFSSGLYIVKAIDNSGNIVSKKILL